MSRLIDWIERPAIQSNITVGEVFLFILFAQVLTSFLDWVLGR